MLHPKEPIEVEIGLIENEDGWPNWPVLPVKKADGSGQIGLLLGRDLNAKRGDPFRLYPGVNMWHQPNPMPEPEMVTAQELVEKGWVVD